MIRPGGAAARTGPAVFAARCARRAHGDAGHGKLRAMKPIPSIAAPVLCLSGSGFRAALFAAGSLLRLAEAGALAPGLRVQAVSGGALAAACLAAAWSRLQAEGGHAAAIRREVLGPLQRLCSRTLDGRSVVGGLLFPRSGAEWLSHHLDREICHGLLFGDLPPDLDLTIGASALSDGGRVAIGNIERARTASVTLVAPALRLSDAVCASIALPPATAAVALARGGGESVSLVDGALADPLARADAGNWLLVCDGAGSTAAPATDLRAEQAARVTDLLLDALREPAARGLREQLVAGDARGACWGLRSSTADYAADTGLVCPPARAAAIAALPGRYAALAAEDQERLVNWGYAICDLALRSGPYPALPMPAAFPFHDGGL